MGTSVARGPFVTDAMSRAAPVASTASDFTQTAWGGDVEYSRDYYLVRLESIVSAWRIPQVAKPFVDLPLRAVSTSIEGRYKFTPGFYAAGRFDHLGFSDVTGTATSGPWDAPVTRVEVGVGYSIMRNLLFKTSVQRNVRDAGRLEREAHLLAGQLVFWF